MQCGKCVTGTYDITCFADDKNGARKTMIFWNDGEITIRTCYRDGRPQEEVNYGCEKDFIRKMKGGKGIKGEGRKKRGDNRGEKKERRG